MGVFTEELPQPIWQGIPPPLPFPYMTNVALVEVVRRWLEGGSQPTGSLQLAWICQVSPMFIGHWTCVLPDRHWHIAMSLCERRLYLNLLTNYKWLGFVSYHSCMYIYSHLNEDVYLNSDLINCHLSGTRSCTTRRRRWGRPQKYPSMQWFYLVPPSSDGLQWLSPLNNFPTGDWQSWRQESKNISRNVYFPKSRLLGILLGILKRLEELERRWRLEMI